jgi:hypothetical protein
MSRLKNQEKAGFFPIPPKVTDLILGYIRAPEGGRILDPCTGTSQALYKIATTLSIEPYGVELQEDRAIYSQAFFAGEIGESYRSRIVHDDFRNLKATPSAFNLLYVNPPYMFAADGSLDGRAEYQWLIGTRPYLQTGGLLIYVVPQHILRHGQTARYIASWFNNIHAVRFPDESYPQFKQIVLFGTRRDRSGIADPEVIARLKRLAEAGEGMMSIDTGLPMPYYLPKLVVPEEKLIFRGMFVTPETAINEAATRGVNQTLAFRQHLEPGNGLHKLEPLTPMRLGHLTGIIAAGHINNQVLEKDDERLLIKGSSFKRKVRTTEREDREEGAYVVYTKDTEQVVTNITILDEQGAASQVEGSDLTAFLEEWIQPLTEVVATSYPPKYTFDLNGFGPVLDQLNLKRKIPLLNKPGLLPTQKHAAAAAATRLLAHDDCIIVGKMGTGKTLMGPAVAAALRSKQMKMDHIIVLCPPHLIDKWIREIKITWPVAKATPLKTIEDVDRFFAEPGPIFGILKETTARSGSGWEHAIDYVGPRRMKRRKSTESVKFLGNTEFPADDDNAKALQYQLQRGIRCPACGERQIKDDVLMMTTDFTSAKKHCQKCAAPLWQDTRFGEAGKAKYPLANYIKKRYKKELDLLIADECHQFKGQDSDRGDAFARLCTAARKVLLLTGTIYGGKASTLFYLLYRASAEMRKAYTNKETSGKRRLMLKEWIENFGILQEIETKRFDEHGKMSGNSRAGIVVKELPGGSPAMLPWLLNNSVFVALEDMGYALPGYKEIPVPISMTPEMQTSYNYLEAQLNAELRQRLIVGDKSLLGAYLQSLLSWPDSPWRTKGVTDPKGQMIAFVDALPYPPGSYPKEEAIIEQIKESKAAGRKVLLACQQTNTLDITPQWVTMLEEEGIKAAVLKVEANKREAWYQRQMEAGVDVIITHPKRVETGLDLMECVDLIWMGTEYSIYTILQFNKRSYRIGQTEDVNVYFYIYEDTLQETALHLIAAKSAAASRVDGDIVQDDTLAELDDLATSDMVTALGKLVMEGLVDGEATEVTKVQSLSDVFAEANADFHKESSYIGGYVQEDVVPDPTAESGDGFEVEELPPVMIMRDQDGRAVIEQRSIFESYLEDKDLAQEDEPNTDEFVTPEPPFDAGTVTLSADTAESGDKDQQLETIGPDGELYAFDQDEDAWECVTCPEDVDVEVVIPDSWVLDDFVFLREKLGERPILVADGGKLGIPTIHDPGLRNARHIGYGYFTCETPEYTVDFEGGGALRRTPSENAWCFLTIKKGTYPYDEEAVRKKLDEWIRLATPQAGAEPVEIIKEEPIVSAENDPNVVIIAQLNDDLYLNHTTKKFTKKDGEVLRPVLTGGWEAAEPVTKVTGKPEVYRNGISCLAMKETEPGAWMQCSKQELHKGFCDFSLGPDQPEPGDVPGSTAESSEAAAPPKVEVVAPIAETGEVARAPIAESGESAGETLKQRLVFGVHDRRGGFLKSEFQDKKAVKQMSLFD